ncbi:right-handed parallel beta-helix repeat-containing protein [Pseudomonas indica]|nr:right-handed parallel beta-helix repeat-containing protein [Pseudomonas indica]
MKENETLPQRWGKAAICVGAFAGMAMLSPLAVAAKAPLGFGQGVTGGEGGVVIEVSTAAELESALCDPKKLSGDKRVCSDSSPRIIKIKGVIDYNAADLQEMKTSAGCYYADEEVCIAKGVPAKEWDVLVADNSSYSGHCKSHTGVDNITYNNLGLKPLAIGSNTTVMGVGKNSGIKGRGFAVRNASNIIIRNLSITDINERIVFVGDGILLENADKVWIDQNRFSHVGRQFITLGYAKTTNVTISDNDFDGTSKQGKSCNGAHAYELYVAGQNQSVTIVGNWFRNFRSRAPIVMPPDGDGPAPVVHMANNYFEHGTWHGLDAYKPARVLVEGNYYEDVQTPILRYPDSDSKGQNAGYVFAPLATEKQLCKSKLKRECTANLVFNANPKPYSLPVERAFTLDANVLDAMKVAAGGKSVFKAYPAKNVPRRVKAEAGPQDWLR